MTHLVYHRFSFINGQQTQVLVLRIGCKIHMVVVGIMVTSITALWLTQYGVMVKNMVVKYIIQLGYMVSIMMENLVILISQILLMLCYLDIGLMVLHIIQQWGQIG